MTDTYIFDLDDTLIDNAIFRRMYNELVTRIVSEIGVSEIDLQIKITKLKNETGKIDTFELCKNIGCLELYYEILEKYVRLTFTMNNPGIPALFKKIKKENKRIGIASGFPEKTIKLFLERFDLMRHVDFLESGKKDTVYFWMTVERKHAIDKTSALVIDDSDEILEVAKNTGYKVLNIKKIESIESFKL